MPVRCACGMQAYMSSTEKDDSQVVNLPSTKALMVKDIFKTATSRMFCQRAGPTVLCSSNLCM